MIKELFHRHFQAIRSATLRLKERPFENILNIIVITMLITVTSFALITTKTAKQWQDNNMAYPQILIFLKQNATSDKVGHLEAMLNKFNAKLIKSYQFISKEAALKELQEDPNFKNIESSAVNLDSNPLPDTLVINTTSNATVIALKDLVAKIEEQDIVQSTHLDTSYALKVEELVSFIKLVNSFLQWLFVFIFMVVIYNYIRLQMSLRHEEIQVSRLIGASDSFIMRPLIYYVLLQVIASSVISFALIKWVITYCNKLLMQYSNLFGPKFLITFLSFSQLAQLTIILMLFSIFAVFTAVRWVFNNMESKSNAFV